MLGADTLNLETATMGANGLTETEIQRFYRGKNVLVTGATGFMGKTLVEKLLRSTKVGSIFMLVRHKKGKTVEQRASEYFDDVIFSRLKKEVKEYQSRVRVVEGDVSLPGLGLTAEDVQLLQAEVEILFHGAATVRFDEALERAISTNVRGTKQILHLAKGCVKLQAFVHISTAYANCTKSEIHEDFFEPPITGDNAIRLTEVLSGKQLSDISEKLCGEYPNTYAFTKAVAENIVNVYGKGLPVVVFRPAIVVATAEEPLKGWVDNVYGPTGVQCGVGAGLLRTFQVNEDYVAELVPVDMAVNAITISAWDIAQNRVDGDDEIPIYNYVSSCQNPLVWGQFIEMSLRHGRETPTVKAIWFYTASVSKYPLVYMFYQLLLHLLPALIVDSVLTILGKKPRLWDAYKKIHKFSKVITYFSMRQWRFHNGKVLNLWNRLSKEDQKLFNFDITSLDWDTYFKNSIIGLRSNFFNDTPDTIPAARRKQLWFRLIHHSLQGLLAFLALWLLYKTVFLARVFYRIFTPC